MKNDVNKTSLIFDAIVGNPYFWVGLGVISLIFMYIKYTNPKSLEWIDVLINFFGGFLIYAITFQWLTQAKDNSDKFISFLKR